MASEGNGYAVSSLDELGEGYGFRKIRRGLRVTAFGINAIVLPSHYETPSHYHEEQEETYFVHQGEVEFILGDGTRHLLGPGGLVRVDPEMPRGMRNAGDRDAILVVAGGKGGYVGRDGIQVQESTGDPPARTSPGDAPAETSPGDAPAGTSPGDAPAGDGPAATGAPGAA